LLELLKANAHTPILPNQPRVQKKKRNGAPASEHSDLGAPQSYFFPEDVDDWLDDEEEDEEEDDDGVGGGEECWAGGGGAGAAAGAE